MGKSILWANFNSNKHSSNSTNTIPIEKHTYDSSNTSVPLSLSNHPLNFVSKHTLKTTNLTSPKIASFTKTNYKPVTGTTNNRSRKRMVEINHDADDKWKENVFPTFDLHMRKISLGNGDKSISTIAFEVRYHSDNSSILQSYPLLHLIWRHNLFVWRNYAFQPLLTNTIFRHQIITQNNFLHKLAIIIIFNIDSDIMYSEILPSLQQDSRFKGVERTHSTDSDGSGLSSQQKRVKKYSYRYYWQSHWKDQCFKFESR